MKKLFIMVAVILMSAALIFAQEWAEGSDRDTEYNCELVNEIIEEYGDQPYLRVDNAVLTFAEFHAVQALGCVSSDDADIQTAATDFKVTVNQNVNLRDCAGTSCGLVGKAQPGDIFEVVAEDGDWYEIKFERGTAFIAGWLTTRLPDEVIETGEGFIIEDTGCHVIVDSRRGDMDINIIITGERLSDVTVDLYRPNETNPLRVEGQLDKTFIDTGGSYLHQYYRWNQWFPNGIYTIEVKIDRKVYEIAWNMTERVDYNIFVACN